MLLLWRDELQRQGKEVRVWFVSVDEDREELARFLSAHPAVAPGDSARLTAPDALGAWLKTLGVDEMASVPIHVIAAPGGRVRCVRTGSLNDGDFSIVRNLLR